MAKKSMTDKEMLERMLYRRIRYDMGEAVKDCKENMVDDLMDDTGIDFSDEGEGIFDKLFEQVVNAAIMGIEGCGFDTQLGGSNMRIAQITCDWKAQFDGRELAEKIKWVGGAQKVYDYDQDTVDDNIMFVSSAELSRKQLDVLWDVGDEWTSTDDGWEGDTFEDIVEQIREYVDEMEKE